MGIAIMGTPSALCVVGCGYVGLVAAACFAEMGHRVFCVDNDQARIDLLRSGGVPIFERDLPELLSRHRNSINFICDIEEAAEASDVVFIAVGTPQDPTGGVDLSYVETAISGLSRTLTRYKVIVEKSTVPVRTSTRIRRLLERHRVDPACFDIASNPEFLREGSAVIDFLHPDRIIVGAESQRAAEVLARVYEPLTSGRYYEQPGALRGPRSAACAPPLLQTSPESAEIIKHASNSFLALKISFINAVSTLAEAVGADIEEIAKGMGMDSRIGPRFLRAGLGYGGSCFPKDVAAFQADSAQSGVGFRLLDDICNINDYQKKVFVNKVAGALWTLRGKRVAVLGLAYKGGTDDIRKSPSIEVVQRLLSEGAVIVAYDPAAMEKTQTVLPVSDNLSYAHNLYDAASGADAALILTDWEEFKSIDLDRLAQVLRYPIVIDGRNLYSAATMVEHGFTYISMGRPDASPQHLRKSCLAAEPSPEASLSEVL
jgi:UDPglucose 6-dehydrogenase